MPLNEADTRAQLIDPQLNVAGWTRGQVTREHYYRTDWAYTAGKIVLRGDRAERAREFRHRERTWLDAQSEEARAVILALVDKYELGGLREMTDPAIFRVSPFREMGEARGVLRRFGGDARRFRETMTELQRRLYAA